MKLNWKVRFKNPYFWVGLGGVVLCAMGVSLDMLTSWQILLDNIKKLFSNPAMLVSVAVALWGYVQDFTTKGFGDTDLAMTYVTPRQELQTVEEIDEMIEQEAKQYVIRTKTKCTKYYQ